MTEATREFAGWLWVGFIVLVIAGGVARARARSESRDPRTLLATITVGTEPATAVRPRFSLTFGALVMAYFGVLLGLLALDADTAADRVFFLVPAAYVLWGAAYIVSGRIGDRTIVFTRDGLRQRYAGLEQSVRWDDITGGRRIGLVYDFEASAVEVRRTAPRLLVGRGRQCLVDGAMRVQFGDVAPSLAVLESMATWIMEPGRRWEIGTDAAVERLIWRPEEPPTSS